MPHGRRLRQVVKYPMTTILVTNDDGVHAQGIKALAHALESIGEVYVIAPDRERSASGHSLTIHKPLRVLPLGERTYAVTGTPTDCVAVGVAKIMPRRPDLIVSGINHGPNLGDDITYSGTVSAALEGTILNIPSMAVSISYYGRGEAHFDSAARVACEMGRFVLEHALPYDTLLNINVPNVPYDMLKGHRLTRQGRRVYDGAIHETASPWGDMYYWIGGGVPYWEQGEDTDISAVLEGYVSLTPLHLDLTNYGIMEFMRGQLRTWKDTKS